MIRLAIKNILHDRLSASLAILLVALSVALVLYVSHVDRQFQSRLEGNLAGVDMILSAKGSPLQSVLCNLYHVDNPTGNILVKDVKAFFNPNHPLIAMAVPLSVGDSYKSYRIVGTTADLATLYNGSLIQGIWWNDAHATSDGVVLGAEVATALSLKLGDQFRSAHGLIEDGMDHQHDTDLTVIGILTNTGTILDRLILTSYETIWNVHADHDHDHAEDHDHDHDHDHADHHHTNHSHHDHSSQPSYDEIERLLSSPEESITSVLMSFKNPNHQTLNMVRSINENTTIMASRPSWELTRLFELTGAGSQMLHYLAWLIGGVALLSVFLSLLQRLNARPEERALLRVMGARPMELFSLVMAEGLILVLVGVILGIVLCHLGLLLTNTFIDQHYPYRIEAFRIGRMEAYVTVIGLILGIWTALWPAMKAYRTDVSMTLRQV